MADVETRKESQSAAWPAVLCLIGLDYFSTLAYQPSIAFEAAGRAAPVATGFLVLVALLGVLPVYLYIAGRSHDGLGAIGLLERLIPGWRGKTLVLVLLGFVATDFVIMKTISAANAAEHIIANRIWAPVIDVLGRTGEAARPHLASPFWQGLADHWDRQVVVTCILLVLGFSFWAFFRPGFTRGVLRLSVFVVVLYLVLNSIVVVSGLLYLGSRPELLRSWIEEVSRGEWGMPGGGGVQGAWATAALCLLAFPQLALGLSGFELSMVVMPLVRGGPGDDPGRPRLLIRNTRKLLLAAVLLMSVALLGSILVTSILIPGPAFLPAGPASHRALAYLAHGGAITGGGDAASLCPMFGPIFGTIHDIGTVLILCLAGASVTIGLRDFVPRYLSRLGMELEWAHNIGFMLHLFNCINLIVIVVFRASFEAQRQAYVTSVVVLLTAAALAALLDVRKASLPVRAALMPSFLLALILCAATAVVTSIRDPGGLFIASAFVLAILVTSLGSRLIRSKELRFEGFEFQDDASLALWEKLKVMEFPVLVPHRPGRRSVLQKEEDIRRVHRLGLDVPVVFVEAELGDASDFYQRPLVRGIQEEGRIILRITRCVSIAHVLAAVLLELSRTTRPPEIHFGWSEESSIAANINFLVFGEGNVPWLVKELLRNAVKDPDRCPRVIVG